MPSQWPQENTVSFSALTSKLSAPHSPRLPPKALLGWEEGWKPLMSEVIS